MQRSRMGEWRLLAVVAVVLLIQAHTASSTMVAASQGRDQSECVQACNLVRDECTMICEDDCSLLYPPGNAYDNCVAKCKLDCLDEMQLCKAKCNINRPPPHPTEP